MNTKCILFQKSKMTTHYEKMCQAGKYILYYHVTHFRFKFVTENNFWKMNRELPNSRTISHFVQSAIECHYFQ